MKSRARSRPKLVAQQVDECEDKNEAGFKHYDNKFFDMDSLAEDPKPCSTSVLEIQELQQYVTNCYDALYKDFNDFKSSVTNQLLTLQEEVQTLSILKNGRNDVLPEAIRESPSHYGSEAVEGRKDKFSQWHSKGRVPDYEEYEKAPQFHHEVRLHNRPDSRSPSPTEEPSPREQSVKRPPYQTDDDRVQRLPASAWSNISESSSRGSFNQTDAQSTERNQETTYLSRHLHGSRSPKSARELPKSTSRGSKGRPGWSAEKSHEFFPTSTTCAWQEEAEEEPKDYEEEEEENELAIEDMVSEYSHDQRNGMQKKDEGFSNRQVKCAGKDRFTLHGWAASFLQPPTDVQLSKAVNKRGIQTVDKESNSKLVASDDIRGGETRAEQSLVEMEITNKGPSVAFAKGNAENRTLLQHQSFVKVQWLQRWPKISLSQEGPDVITMKGDGSTVLTGFYGMEHEISLLMTWERLRNVGSLSRSNSDDTKPAKNMNYINLNSSKPAAAIHEKRESNDLNQQTDSDKFPGKKCRGGIAWTVDEIAEQNKQRAVL